MKRKTSSAVIERNRPILKRIEELKREHPFWGYRKVWAHLVYIDQLTINKKRVYNLMKQNDLLVKPLSDKLLTEATSEEPLIKPVLKQPIAESTSDKLEPTLEEPLIKSVLKQSATESSN